MKNITNLQKDTGYTPATQETDSEHMLSPQDKQLIEFQCIYDSILRCMHSPQDMQLIELANGYYHYRQQENLVEQTDNSYAVPIEKIQRIEFTSYAMEHATSQEKAVISLDPAFFDKLKDIYTQAYILYMNGIDKKVKHRECEYLKKLYFRSTEAANRLRTAMKACEETEDALRNSSGGKTLIESIVLCRLMIAKLEMRILENADNLERYIRDSGAEGRAWYEALKSMEEESEEMHGE